jgi:hypothetical protein
MLYDKPWEHPDTVATLSIVVLLSARLNSSTRSTVAMLQTQQGKLAGLHLRFISPVMTVLREKTLLTVNRKYLFMNILCTVSFCPQKRTTERCSSVVYFSSTVVILTTETSL